MDYTYVQDTSGALAANKITGEQQILTIANDQNYHFVVPRFAPFFASTLSVVFKGADNVTRPLIEGLDYYCTYLYVGASRACAKPIYGGISFINLQLNGVVTLNYQTLGGPWTLSATAISEMLSNTLRNPRTTTWEQVANVPQVFPPVDHEWDLSDMVGMSQVVDSLDQIAIEIAKKAVGDQSAKPTMFPTKKQVGLGNVDNFKTASVNETILGTSVTQFATPKGVSAAIDFKLQAFVDAEKTRLKSNSMPLSGSYSAGTYVSNTALSVKSWSSSPLSLLGAKYVVRGWLRITTGTNHVLNIDWVEDRVLMGM